jgi:hypothetical protein
MQTFKFETYFGYVAGHYAEDCVEFETGKNCQLIAMDSDQDGPYWEEDSHNWDELNDLCREITGENIYRTAERAKTVLIDSTDSYEEMGSWKAWVTDNPNRLYGFVENTVKEELAWEINKDIPEILNEGLGWSGREIIELRDAVFDEMKEKGSNYFEALQNAAEEKGYDVI